MRTKVVVALLAVTALVVFAAPMVWAAEPAAGQAVMASGEAKLSYFQVAAYS